MHIYDDRTASSIITRMDAGRRDIVMMMGQEGHR